MKTMVDFLLRVIFKIFELTCIVILHEKAVGDNEKRIRFKLKGLGLNSPSCAAHWLSNFEKAKLL